MSTIYYTDYTGVESKWISENFLYMCLIGQSLIKNMWSIYWTNILGILYSVLYGVTYLAASSFKLTDIMTNLVLIVATADILMYVNT